MRTFRIPFAGCLALVTAAVLSAQGGPAPDPTFLGALHWRSIGPYRAGRVSAVAGDPSDQNVYYAGMAGGGVWKTSDGGQTWNPVTDAVHLAPIGAVAVSASNPAVVYAGAGEGGWAGDGVWKTSDGGATWTSAGLKETHIIGAIVVDPADPDIVLVGASGNATSGQARGVFKSIDGGRTWTQTLMREGAGLLVDCGRSGDTARHVCVAFERRRSPQRRGAARGRRIADTLSFGRRGLDLGARRRPRPAAPEHRQDRRCRRRQDQRAPPVCHFPRRPLSIG